MTEKDVTISIPAGLTAKTVTVIVEKANSFSSSIVFESDHRRVNGKSLLGVLSLGLKCGDTFALSASGRRRNRRRRSPLRHALIVSPRQASVPRGRMPAFEKGSVHMIQDIAPKQFSVAYDLHVPESGDTICLFRGSRILGARCTDGELRLPRFCELPVQESDCWFLFSVSSRNYFWCAAP